MGAWRRYAGRMLSRLEECVDEALRRAGPLAKGIAAVAPDTFWHNVVGVSASGAPITPVYTWADTRAAAAAEELKADLDQAKMHARTGAVLHPSYLPAKLRWLQSSGPTRPALRLNAGPGTALALLCRLSGSPFLRRLHDEHFHGLGQRPS